LAVLLPPPRPLTTVGCNHTSSRIRRRIAVVTIASNSQKLPEESTHVFPRDVARPVACRACQSVHPFMPNFCVIVAALQPSSTHRPLCCTSKDRSENSGCSGRVVSFATNITDCRLNPPTWSSYRPPGWLFGLRLPCTHKRSDCRQSTCDDRRAGPLPVHSFVVGSNIHRSFSGRGRCH